jgi:dTDP-4-dehydrorhamnose 3,5-epimerase
MEFRRFSLDGPVEVIPRKIEDERGYFMELFRLADFLSLAGPAEFVQDNQSLSTLPGTIRGIHFQTDPFAQGKLVRCLAGKVLDVAVDLRRNSPDYGKWVAVTLTPEASNQLWVPVGFGHAFCSLEPNSVIHYRVTNYYSAECDKGVAWNDPDIAIDWPAVADPDTLSQKDRRQPSLVDLPAYFAVNVN